MTRIIVIAFIFCLFTGSLLSCSRKPPELGWRLQVADPRDGYIYYSIPIADTETFILSYRHSVSGSRVRGTFRLTAKGELNPSSTIFSTYGPGLPFDYYEDYKIENGIITVYHKEEPRREIRLWVTPLTEETLVVADQLYPLYIFSEQEKLLAITAVSIGDFKRRLQMPHR